MKIKFFNWFIPVLAILFLLAKETGFVNLKQQNANIQNAGFFVAKRDTASRIQVTEKDSLIQKNAAAIAWLKKHNTTLKLENEKLKKEILTLKNRRK